MSGKTVIYMSHATLTPFLSWFDVGVARLGRLPSSTLTCSPWEEVFWGHSSALSGRENWSLYVNLIGDSINQTVFVARIFRTGSMYAYAHKARHTSKKPVFSVCTWEHQNYYMVSAPGPSCPILYHTHKGRVNHSFKSSACLTTQRAVQTHTPVRLSLTPVHHGV